MDNANFTVMVENIWGSIRTFLKMVLCLLSCDVRVITRD